MIRQQAFTGENKMLKGGLHCHTTRSDGKLTPEETLKLHKENGYDFLALTDHHVYNTENYAPETNITIIPGMEIDGTFERTNGFRTFHTVCLGYDDESNGFKNGEYYNCKNDVTDQFVFQKYLDEVHARNNITFYCHPEWSSTPARYFDKLEGEFAIEVWNSGCAIEHDIDVNAPYWDEVLAQGKKMWGVAVDDGHQPYHHCKGWVMVNAENNVKAILDALLAGKFYSSCGPVIKDFYIDNGKVYVDCEECDKIWFYSAKHPAEMFTSEKEGHILTHAEYDLEDDYEYVRAVVMDKNGKRAWTNPIFIK